MTRNLKPKPKIDFHVYVGSVRGALAYTQCKPNIKPKYDLQDFDSEITAMEWGRTEEEIIIGNKNGQVKLYDTALAKYTNRNINGIEGVGSVAGLGCFDENIIIGRNNGIVNIWKNNETNDTFSTNLGGESTMECLAANRFRNVIATGGERNDLKVWDIENNTAVFKAKSMGNDELNLPIWTSIRGICFFPGEEKLVACASKQGHVLFYDERVQRRPVTKFYENKACYTVMCTAHRDRQCLVGTTRGYLQHIDLRTNKLVKTFKAFTGGISGLVCDSAQPIVACSSLDRHLRIIHLESKEIVHMEYLKLALTKLLIKPVVKKEVEEEEKEKEDGDQNVEEELAELKEDVSQPTEKDELDELFEDIEEIREVSSPRKRKLLVSDKKIKKAKSDV